MTTEISMDTPKIVSRGPADPVALAIHDEHMRNLEFFFAHEQELFDQHPGKWLLIHSGGEVVASHDLLELHDLRHTLDPVRRSAATIQIRKTGVWIL